MKISVELSIYPLSEDYKTPIKNFIKDLQTYTEIKVEANGISTHVFGEYEQVNNILQKEIKKTMEGEQKIVVISKMMNADRSGKKY